MTDQRAGVVGPREGRQKPDRPTIRMPHLVVEDCWYSCPKSGECCNDLAGDECNCGADRINAYIEHLETEVERLRGAHR